MSRMSHTSCEHLRKYEKWSENERCASLIALVYICFFAVCFEIFCDGCCNLVTLLTQRDPLWRRSLCGCRSLARLSLHAAAVLFLLFSAEIIIISDFWRPAFKATATHLPQLCAWHWGPDLTRNTLNNSSPRSPTKNNLIEWYAESGASSGGIPFHSNSLF